MEAIVAANHLYSIRREVEDLMWNAKSMDEKRHLQWALTDLQNAYDQLMAVNQGKRSGTGPQKPPYGDFSTDEYGGIG